MKRQHPPAVLDFCSKGSGGQLLCIDGEASEARECTLDFLFAVQRHQARRVGQMGLRQPGPPTSWNAKTFSGGGEFYFGSTSAPGAILFSRERG